MLYHPERVLLLGIAAYLLILLVAPVTPTVGLQLGSILFILLCCLTFAAGSWIAGAWRSRPQTRTRSAQWLRRQATNLFLGTFALGLLGNALKLLDTYYLRASGAADAFELRAALSDVQAGPLSALAGALYPFGFIPLLLYLGSPDIRRSPLRLMLALGLFLVPAIDALMLLSRSALMIAFAMIYFGTVLTLYRGQAFPRALRLPTLALVAGFAVVSVLVFQSRLDGMGLDAGNSIYASAYGFTVTPSPWAQQVMQRPNQFGGQLLTGVLPLFQYYTHSLFELQILWQQSDLQPHSYGLLIFDAYVKALKILGIAEQVDVFELFPRVGVFTTFFGPLWVDFGWFSPVLMFLFGFMARRLGLASRRGDVGATPLYTFLCVVLFLAPVANFLVSKGMYAINAFALFWLFARPYAAACSLRDGVTLGTPRWVGAKRRIN